MEVDVNDNLLVKVWGFKMKNPASGDLSFGNDIKISCFANICTVESTIPMKISELKVYADKVENLDDEWRERRKKYEEISRKYHEGKEE